MVQKIVEEFPELTQFVEALEGPRLPSCGHAYDMPPQDGTHCCVLYDSGGLNCQLQYYTNVEFNVKYVLESFVPMQTA